MEAKPKKICFVGGPSTGKSTLAKQLTEELIKQNRSVELVGESARDYIIKHGTIEGPQAQLAICRDQKEREKIAKSRNPEFLVCDVPIFLSQIYFDFLKDKIFDKNKAEELKKMRKEIGREIEDKINSYDFVFFLPPELPPQEDGVRLYTDQIEHISERIDKFLHSNNIKHYDLSGTVKDRMAKAFKIIQNT